ncbi:AI-2E family transporter [Flavitalea sp.]|nr:AI-2E family transporter [Flavitalea sp.]
MKEFPLTVRRSVELIGLFVLGMIIVAGNGVITPLLLAFFLSVVFLPLHRRLMNKKIPEILSISICILILFILLGLIVWFFSAQIGKLIQDFPQLEKNVMHHLNELSTWVNTKTDFSTERQLTILRDQSSKIINNAGSMLGGAATSLTSVFVLLGLVPIYIFLIMFYKNLLLRFIFLWFPSSSHENLKDAMEETQVIVKSYLIGLLIQITYITILLGGILMLFGNKHALLIGVIFAILNLIPYVGALVGNIIGVLLTITSSDELGPVWTVLIVIAAVQFLDNNILMPKIVGSKVRINALASIVGVIVGGALAGVSGMFLSLPVIAVLKIIFDRAEAFKQWGVLFGDERPARNPMSFPVFRKKMVKSPKTPDADQQNPPEASGTIREI